MLSLRFILSPEDWKHVIQRPIGSLGFPLHPVIPTSSGNSSEWTITWVGWAAGKEKVRNLGKNPFIFRHLVTVTRHCIILQFAKQSVNEWRPYIAYFNLAILLYTHSAHFYTRVLFIFTDQEKISLYILLLNWWKFRLVGRRVGFWQS
jgi:hypothetical protein